MEAGWQPFDHLGQLLAGAFDNTTVAVGPGAGSAVFDGAGAVRVTIDAFRRQMTRYDTVFDSQNSKAGRHSPLAIPGTPAAAPGWYNTLSIGSAGSGLYLHSHGAAWLALGSGTKQWAACPPPNHPAAIPQHVLIVTTRPIAHVFNQPQPRRTHRAVALRAC